ncbi:MAG: CHAT domain-containing protein, partial [bacterium]
DQVDTDFVRKNFLDFDLVHYAGHADYEDARPDQSGWILSDGKLRAADILKMAGTKGAMPKFVFGNACQSGFTGKWEKEKITQGQTFPGYGLVHAFLMTGVQHYLGTFCEISDEYSASMGLEFYRHLFEGKSIGEALRRARVSFREKYGEMSFSWINYVLYGHPGDYLIPAGRADFSEDEPARDMAKGVKRADHTSGNSDYVPDSGQVMATLRRSRSPIPHWTGWKRWMGQVLTFCLLFIVTSGLIFFSWGKLKSLPFFKGGAEDVGSVRKQERIEELKRMIYEKLKAREERQPVKEMPEEAGTPEDTWTSKPFVIAIFNISEQDREILPGWASRMILDLERKLTQILVEDNRIRVAERKELDRLLEEKDLQLSDFPLHEQKDLFGRFLYARMMFFLQGYPATDGLSLCYRIVDTGTGEIEKINSGLRLIKSGKPDELARSMHAEMKELMRRKFPLRGRITMVRDNLVVLNIGTGEGVREEDIFEVFDSEQEGGQKMKIGRIKDLGGAVEASKTSCIILEGKNFSKGLWVEIAAR